LVWTQNGCGKNREREEGWKGFPVRVCQGFPQSHLGRVSSSGPDTFLHRDFTLPSRITLTQARFCCPLNSSSSTLLFHPLLQLSFFYSTTNHTVNENKWLSIYTPVSGRGETLPGNGCQQHTEPVTSAHGEVGGHFWTVFRSESMAAQDAVSEKSSQPTWTNFDSVYVL